MTSGILDTRIRSEENGSPTQEATSTLQRILDWQRQVVEITNNLLNVDNDRVDAAINVALARTGKLAGSDRTYVFRLRDGNRLDNTHEWVADGVAPVIDQLQDLPDDVLQDWRDDLTAARQIYIPDISALPDTSVVRDILLEQGIKSLLAAPMLRGKILTGFVGYDAVKEYRQFLPAEIELIQSVANTINAVIDRAKAEAAAEVSRVRLLSESERLRATLAAIPDLLLELDADGRFANAHSGGGLKPYVPCDVFIGQLPEEVFGAEHAALIRGIMTEIDRDGHSNGVEYQLNTPGGAGWFHVTASAKSQPQGKGYILLIRDITEARRQQAQILRLGKIAELTSNLVVITDPNDRIEWVNPAFEKRSGWTLKDLLGHRPKNFLQAGMVDCDARKRIGAAIRRGDAAKGELLNKSRSGEEYWTSIDITPLYGERGMLSGFVAVQADITNLKRAHERALQDLAVAIEETADGVFLSDLNGKLKYANSACRQLFGIGADENIGKIGWRELFLDKALGPDLGTTTSLSQEVWRGDKVGQHRDGREMKLEISRTRREDGSIVAIVRDISERSRQEMERTRLREELQIAQRREMIAHLATGVAHDLNNLIAVVDGTADILEAHASNEAEVLAGTKRIRRATKTARDLAGGLARLDRPATRRAAHDLRGLVTQGADLLGSTRLAENEVTVLIPDDCRPIWGDATDIQQVITNLALNACDAKAEGRANRVGLTVMPQFFAVPTRAPDVGERPAEADCSVFVISDNGTGIDPAHRTQLFERYFTTKGNNGTGLGMPIVASIIRENDAALWFDTVSGKGSTVTVAWPSQAPVRFANIASHAKCLSAEAPLSELRLLIVDDVPDVADVLASLMGMAGATVVVVNDSAKARDLITNPKETWSAILTDFDMPGLSGVDLARAAANITPPLPVILVTALPEQAERNRDLFAAISPKPVDARRLIDLIRAAVTRQSKP